MAINTVRKCVVMCAWCCVPTGCGTVRTNSDRTKPGLPRARQGQTGCQEPAVKWSSCRLGSIEMWKCAPFAGPLMIGLGWNMAR
jgi:uncharacterized protein YceK